MTSPEMTVGDLIDLLSGCDRSAPVRQAMNPFFPMAHRLAQVLQSVDETGAGPLSTSPKGGTRTHRSATFRRRSPSP
ncbi:hypothetical protein SAMN05216260_1432 [Streptomyces griseoaurantiacus]|uniref:Uncharacterized protein n=1 Tax=Streptomyces griseoaurantiacus TaxID=68213 RepID=A0A1G7YJE0_9ACTN|nr:hypothetical protein SAMN05216260_1432 [Streptomyces jietaisiensis]